jgi:hypothetical protein
MWDQPVRCGVHVGTHRVSGRSGSWLRRASWTGAVLGPGEADLVITCEDSHHNKEHNKEKA